MATERTPQQIRQQSTRALTQQLNQGYNAGGPMGAMAAFMGIPNLAAGRRIGGMSDVPAGSFRWPTDYPGSPSNLAGKPPSTGGDGPSVDPNNPDGPMLKAGLPPWYVDWLRTSGQYGVWNQPPGGGLLD
jgi:hypothetical protein